MRKTLIDPDSVNPSEQSQQKWLDLKEFASVELTSEDPNFPIEFAIAESKGSGWRAAEPGKQVIRIVLNEPKSLHRVRLEFAETDIERTQEFTLRWSQAGGPFTEIVRQQWSFSPHGSTIEVEDYQVDLERASVLELTLKPDLTPDNAVATLAAWRVA